MIHDPIVEEIHDIRTKLSEQFQFDIRRIFEDVKRQEQQHPERVRNLQRQQSPTSPQQITVAQT